eukprot:Gb_11801 [translate_table: standard]
MIPSSLNAAGITPCPDCGSMHVPYPLSTGDGCGDPSYRVHCNSNKKLELGVLNGTSYPILSINPGSQRLIIQPAPLLPDVCATEDLRSEGILLNKSLPFNITSSNTLMLLNCSPRLLLSPLNCTSSSLCHQYIDQVEEAKPCRSSGLCCTFVAGGSSSSYKIHVWNRGCRAYRSIVNVNPALPARQWTKGVELQWVSPREPSCESQRNCGPNSSCLQDRKSGGSRCLCNTHFRWDPISGTCAKNKSVCRTRGGCHRRAPLVAGESTNVLEALVSGLFAAIAGTIVLILIYRRKKLLREAQAGLAKQRADILSANSGGKSARIFSSKEVKKATNGFSKDRILGSGGFGEVYKGVLEDGTNVAVKAAKVGNTKGVEQVLNEVRILSQVNHRNLVRLLGCCVEAEQPLMIYEYIPNGTLYDHLHTPNRMFLDWKTRLNIAFQTAEGLAYLHSAAYTPIYHRDVKSSNILLDDKLNAKVSDFGLSRLAEPDLTHISTCAQGTLGYLDPEYYRNYQLTDKSDVYSFGVVLLELVTSQKAIDFSRGADDVNLAVHVLEKSEEGKIMDIADPLLTTNSSQAVLDTIKALAFLALGCLQEKRQDRPTMKEVAEELQYIISIEAAGIVDVDYNAKKADENGRVLRLNWY